MNNCKAMPEEDYNKRYIYTAQKSSHYYYRSFALSGSKLQNKLSAAIKNATALKDFKKVLKTHLFKQVYDS